ncbi:MAG: hypothetical protein WBA91_09655 [Paracoccaceae bacterium]
MTVDQRAKCPICQGSDLARLIDLGQAVEATSLEAGPNALPRAAAARGALAFMWCKDCLTVSGTSAIGSLADVQADIGHSEALFTGQRAFAMRMCERLPLNGRSLVLCHSAAARGAATSFSSVGVPVGALPPLADGQADLGPQPKANLILLAEALCQADSFGQLLPSLAPQLADDGVVVADVPFLPMLAGDCRVDWLQHHRTLFPALAALAKAAAKAGLRLCDLQEIDGREGWARIFLCQKAARWPTGDMLMEAMDEERDADAILREQLGSFERRSEQVRHSLVDFLTTAHYGRKTVAVYGASSAAVRVFDYVGLGADLVAYAVDPEAERQSRFIAKGEVAVLSPDELRRRPPDFVLVLTADTYSFIRDELADLRAFGTTLVTAFPAVALQT